jgi:hypothetical protein
VHATEAAGREDADARGGGQQGGARDRRRPAEAECRRDRQVADAELGQVWVGAHPVDLVGRQPHVRNAVEDGDGGRHRPAGADGGLDLVGGVAVVRSREAVREQGALERDDRPAGVQGVGDLRREVDAGGMGGLRDMHPVIMDGSRSGRTP